MLPSLRGIVFLRICHQRESGYNNSRREKSINWGETVSCLCFIVAAFAGLWEELKKNEVGIATKKRLLPDGKEPLATVFTGPGAR